MYRKRQTVEIWIKLFVHEIAVYLTNTSEVSLGIRKLIYLIRSSKTIQSYKNFLRFNMNLEKGSSNKDTKSCISINF